MQEQTEVQQMKTRREELLKQHQCTDCLKEKQNLGKQIEKLTKWIDQTEEKTQ